MQDKKYTLIINYPVLAAGGIEQALAPMMKRFMDAGHRVIWITTKRHIQNVVFQDLINDPRLEIVTSGLTRAFGTPRIELKEDERAIMITCVALKYVVSEGIRRKAKTKNFMHYYAVAHFTGSIYYPETGMKSKLGQKIVYSYWKKILQQLVDHNCILGFNPKHLQCYEEHYGILIPDKEKRIMPQFDFLEFDIDMERIKRRCAERKDTFVITTCSRFEFPHKAYLMGLIDAFAEVKQKYPQTRLRIIGYGSREEEINSKIAALPEEIRKDIERIGMVTPDQVKEYYKDSHLVVGLAGAGITGAQCGVPALLARHYCYDCETYGFFADAPEKILGEDKGEPIVPYIASCITMDEDAYLGQVKRGVEILSKFNGAKSDFFIENFKEMCPLFVKTPWEILLGGILHIVSSVCRRFEGQDKRL